MNILSGPFWGHKTRFRPGKIGKTGVSSGQGRLWGTVYRSCAWGRGIQWVSYHLFIVCSLSTRLMEKGYWTTEQTFESSLYICVGHVTRSLGSVTGSWITERLFAPFIQLASDRAEQWGLLEKPVSRWPGKKTGMLLGVVEGCKSLSVQVRFYILHFDGQWQDSGCDPSFIFCMKIK